MTALPQPIDLPGWTHIYSGKVRDLYKPNDGSEALLIVASDRVSAFDHVLEPPIPGKGALLTALSNWWFSRINMPNHLWAGELQIPDEVAERAVIGKRLNMFPIECVVRRALTGSGFLEYQRTGAVCGIELPAGIQDGDLLDTPIYTPAYKAPLGEHDENITYEQTEELVGRETAARLREASLHIFTEARERASERGIVLADTKFEFGSDPHTGEIVLADEVLTSDSSRYWDATAYQDTTLPRPDRLASFDKQIVRDWLTANWDRQGIPPQLPEHIVAETRSRYRELLERLTS